MSEQDVVRGDLVAEIGREIEVLGFPRVAQAAHGFVGEDAGERLGGGGDARKPIQPGFGRVSQNGFNRHPDGKRQHLIVWMGSRG